MKFTKGIISDVNNILKNHGAVYIHYNKEKGEVSCADLVEGYIGMDGKREYNIRFNYWEYPVTKKAIISKTDKIMWYD